MWACLQDQETPGHWKHVAGWRKVCELAQNHLRQLRQYRAGLAEAWPPATNAAARTYLGELDELISKVQRTHDTAAANHDALAAVARAIDSTRPELKRIRDDYAEKLARKRGYEATLADPRAAAGSRVVDPPVTDADLERLNVRARGLMFGLSGELQQAQAMLQKPPVARPVRKVDDEVHASSLDGQSGPLIPPIIPAPINPTTEADRLSSSRRPTPPLATPSAGPILGGAGVTSSSQLSNTVLPGASSTAPSISNMGPQISGPSMLPPQPPPQIRGPGIPTISHPKGRLPSALPQPTMPNGLIGTPPSINSGPPGSAAATRRVNPIGGVIGGGSAGTAPTGAAGTRPGIGRTAQSSGLHGLPPFGGAPNFGTHAGPGTHESRPDRHSPSEARSRNWDKDNPWETDEGVDPIVLPPEDEGPIDPGPVIGFSR